MRQIDLFINIDIDGKGFEEISILRDSKLLTIVAVNGFALQKRYIILLELKQLLLIGKARGLPVI